TSAKPSGGVVGLLNALGSAEALITSVAWAPLDRKANAPPTPARSKNKNTKRTETLGVRLESDGITLMGASYSTLVGGSCSTPIGGSSSKKRRGLPPGSCRMFRLGASKSCACIQSSTQGGKALFGILFGRGKKFRPAAAFFAIRLKMP